MCTVQICTKANIHVNRVKSLPATCAMLSVKLKICQPKSFGQGCGGNGGTCRRAEERGCSGGGSSASMVKLTLRSSDELTTKPPAMRGFRNRSFRPCPYFTHSSVTETIMTAPEMGAGCLSPWFASPQ